MAFRLFILLFFVSFVALELCEATRMYRDGYWIRDKFAEKHSDWYMRVKSRGFNYIKRFYDADNFIPRGRSRDSRYPASKVLETGLRSFQRWGGLDETGEIDEPTVRLMSRPRCGVPDEVQYDMLSDVRGDSLRVRRNTNGKWNKNDLTYHLKNYPDLDHSIISMAHVDEAIKSAFKIWSDVTPLTFRRINDESAADIVLLFGRGRHTESPYDSPFDGMGGIFGHAFPPNANLGALNGDVHFDNDEQFTHKEYFGTNLFDTAAHEIGHALGLNHINVQGSLMYPWPRGYIPGFQLAKEDIDAIQALYGPNPNPNVPVTDAPPMMTTPYMNAGAPFCNITFDDVAYIDGNLYVFKNYIYWRFNQNGRLLNGVSGSLIRDFLLGGSSRVSAIFERWYDGKIIHVRGSRLYYYTLEMADSSSIARLDEDFPKLVSEYGMDKGLTAAFHRGSEYTSYYFKGKRVYAYNEYTKVLEGGRSRRASRVFSGLPDDVIVTSAFTFYDGMSYFVVDSKYYMMNNDGTVNPTAQDFAQDFLGCPPPSVS